MGKEEDKKLVSKALNGDENAFKGLLKTYERPVYTICFRMVQNRDEAQDLAQEAFVKVFSMLDRYNPQYSFSSWLFKITSNLCIDFLRKRRVDMVPMDETYESERGELRKQYKSPCPNPESVVERKETAAYLQEAVSQLPDHYRLIILLRHQEGLSYDEIAGILEIPLGTVKARIHRARNMLKEALKRMGFSG